MKYELSRENFFYKNLNITKNVRNFILFLFGDI